LFKEGKAEEALQKYESELTELLPLSKTKLNVDFLLESLRYLDLHPVLPEDSPAELKTSFDALLAPLLLNSSLAAIKAQPKSAANSLIAITNTTRALNKLQLSDVDKGTFLFFSLFP
jgi:peptidyl-prolyl isomerase D